MHYSIRQVKKTSLNDADPSIALYSIRLTGINFSDNSDIPGVLSLLQFCREEFINKERTDWLIHPLTLTPKPQTKTTPVDTPLSSPLIEDEDPSVAPAPSPPSSSVLTEEEQPLTRVTEYYYLEPSIKLNQLLARKGTLIQQIEYLSYIGVTDAIDRRSDLRAAVNHHTFHFDLLKHDLINPSYSLNSKKDAFAEPIRRIHAVHLLFLSDPEIRSGLYISQQKDTEINKVLYAGTPESLELAIRYCEPNTKLIIDGHWEHGKSATHGVWEYSNAAEIAAELSILLTKYPGKVTSIVLLGCQAGYLSAFESLPEQFKPQSLLFKDKTSPAFFQKEMAKFRNRAIYHSLQGEFPFAKNSLAGEIISKISHLSIKVSACSSRTYPFPPGAKGKFNIGSDAPTWEGEHFWKESVPSVPDWYSKLHQLKGITFISQGVTAHPDPTSRGLSARTEITGSLGQAAGRMGFR